LVRIPAEVYLAEQKKVVLNVNVLVDETLSPTHHRHTRSARARRRVAVVGAIQNWPLSPDLHDAEYRHVSQI
jgi:hypothetical protein